MTLPIKTDAHLLETSKVARKRNDDIIVQANVNIVNAFLTTFISNVRR